MPEESLSLTNIDPNKVSEALATLTVDMTEVGQAMNVVKKKRKTMKDHQTYYEQEFGIDAKAIRDRYDEMQMTPRERERKYVLEQITRRAVNLWDAESPEDFDELMAAASETQAASGDSASRLSAARARADGFNSGLNGGMAVTDNPHTPGSLEHQEWAIGCADAIGESREAPAMEAATDGKGQETPGNTEKRRAGRPKGSPNRKTASALLDDNAAKLNGDQPTEDAGFFGGAVDEMPATADLPE